MRYINLRLTYLLTYLQTLNKNHETVKIFVKEAVRPSDVVETEKQSLQVWQSVNVRL